MLQDMLECQKYFKKRAKDMFERQYVLKVFFLAHAVRARGSDGHQNVLWFSVWQHCKAVKRKYNQV